MINGMISVVVPVYNCSKYIIDCVEMLQRQTYGNIEIILVNDGSTDDSELVCLELQDKYGNIIFLSQKNMGAAAARNQGIKHANGEYLVFVDADDSVKEDMLSKLIQHMDAMTDIVCCDYEILGMSKKEKMFDSEFSASMICEKQPLFLQLMDYTYGHEKGNATAIGVPWAKLYRSKMINEHSILFDTSLRRMQDNIFNMEAFVCARTVKYVHEYLYMYRVDHIGTYKKAGLDPEIYLKVLEARRKLFDKYEELKTPKNNEYFRKEHLNFLMMSIHNVTVSSANKRDKIVKIYNLLHEDEYVQGLGIINLDHLSLKEKLQVFLFRRKMPRLLYALYAVKYRREMDDKIKK